MNKTRLVALVVVPATIIGACFGLAAMGVPIDGLTRPHENTTETVADADRPAAAVLPAVTSPGYAAIDAAFTHLDDSWRAQSGRVHSAGLPGVLACIAPAPVVSMSRAYRTHTGHDTQVTITSYTAGVGAHVFSRMNDLARDCKPSSSTFVSKNRSGVGVEGVHRKMSLSGGTAHVESFRHGDVVAHVVTDGENPAVARAVDKVLTRHLTRCVNPRSVAVDVFRNAVAAGGRFTGLLDTERVEGQPVTVRAPAGLSEPPATLPAALPDVTVPGPRDYPVWPELPAPVDKPAMPTPPKEQQLVEDVKVRVADDTGPGCGWTWLAAATPEFDAEQVAADNDAALNAARDRLAADADRFEKDTLRYWRTYDLYVQSADQWTAYVKQVKEVTAAWQAIDAQWVDYRERLARHERQVEVRDDFLDRQAAARATYERQMRECGDRSDIGDGPTATPSPSPSPSPLPSTPSCPRRPAILDQTPPVVGDKPVPPADPRPNVGGRG